MSGVEVHSPGAPKSPIWSTLRKKPSEGASPRLFDGENTRRAKRGSAASAPESGATASHEYYPMWLMPCATFLLEDKLCPHQHLLREGKLVKYLPEYDGRVLFISHQCALGSAHLARCHVLTMSLRPQ